MAKHLKEALRRGEVVVGMSVYTACPAVVETLGYYGYDFVFIDAEHSPITVDQTMEKLIMAARLVGIASLVRVKGVDEIDIRKVLEFGADGVIVPHVKSRAQARQIVAAAKFPPEGRRGADATVRSARYGCADFSWERYIEESNANTMVIPMAEDKEFFDEIDGILSEPGIDAVFFGPTDYALSRNLPEFYRFDNPEIQAALTHLIAEARPKGIGVMTGAAPPTLERAQAMIARGVNLLILGGDIHHFQAACRNVLDQCVTPLRKGVQPQ